MSTSKFIRFNQNIDGIELPKKFNYPFFYQPHPLCIIAAEDLQKHLQSQQVWKHNFGLDKTDKGLAIGKMFGVLVAQNKKGELGYLAAFSGKLADSNHHPLFVPPIYDMLQEGDFFKTEGNEIIEINREIENLTQHPEYIESVQLLEASKLFYEKKVAESKFQLKAGKKERDRIRSAQSELLSERDFNQLKEELKEQSLKGQYFHKLLIAEMDNKLQELESKVRPFHTKIEALKELRKKKSAHLQNKLFRQYTFLNALGEKKDVLEIFSSTIEEKPPAGAGECAAPKLLQYAYLHQLKPLALAEFWWGASPKSEVRKHLQFYPACRSKCEPILSHMLKGIEVEENPMLQNPAAGKSLPIIYEDEAIIVVDKPAEFLSVPGKNIDDSVYSRIKSLYPLLTGPLIIHRLDMSTSGILVLAKDKRSHEFIQKQFIQKKVKKRYIALLDGVLKENEGIIDLPLRLDLDNRPQQLVCSEHGKKAVTKWEKIKTVGERTLVYFYPLTGRTHQLRVHSAHPMGLNTPIVGDDLYGKIENRLHLHAEEIEFIHPTKKTAVKFTAACPF